MSDPIGQDYSEAKRRLEEIAESVARDDMPLDDALDLFEEAVSLGMQISDVLETGLDETEIVEAQEQASQQGQSSQAPTDQSQPEASDN